MHMPMHISFINSFCSFRMKPISSFSFFDFLDNIGTIGVFHSVWNVPFRLREKMGKRRKRRWSSPSWRKPSLLLWRVCMSKWCSFPLYLIYFQSICSMSAWTKYKNLSFQRRLLDSSWLHKWFVFPFVSLLITEQFQIPSQDVKRRRYTHTHTHTRTHTHTNTYTPTVYGERWQKAIQTMIGLLNNRVKTNQR